MSSRKISSIDAGAIISANDLRTGRTVYFTDSGGWSVELKQALLMKDDAQAAVKLSQASGHTDVVGAALIKTTEQGEPMHIRELIRALGPSSAADNAAGGQVAGGSHVPVR